MKQIIKVITGMGTMPDSYTTIRPMKAIKRDPVQELEYDPMRVLPVIQTWLQMEKYMRITI